MNACQPIAASTVELKKGKGDKLAAKVDVIRRHIEQLPPLRSIKAAKLLRGIRFKGESRRLKAGLEDSLQALLELGSTHSASEPSRSECVLEVISLGTRAADAVCEAPGLSFLKPLVNISALICDAAKDLPGDPWEWHGSERIVPGSLTNCVKRFAANERGTCDRASISEIEMAMPT
ncbi:hypothetical protein DFH09DRAFT_1096107 [Mycena vulgaris]|nr:hypothetical protein DFH09DRAFT_1096107 [Mycena vulgaris]